MTTERQSDLEAVKSLNDAYLKIKSEIYHRWPKF